MQGGFALCELFIGCGEPFGSLRNLFLELIGGLFLLGKAPGFLQPNRSLVCGYAQKNCLGLPRKVVSWRPCDYDADFTVAAVSERDDRQASVSKRVSCLPRPFPWVSAQRVLECLADHLRLD